MDTTITFRSPTDEDVPSLVALMIACDEVDVGHPDSDEEDAIWLWRMPGFDRARDSWVVSVDGELVGYASLYDNQADVFVHPKARGRGVGSELLERIEARAAQKVTGTVTLRQNVTSRNEAGRRLLEHAGYELSHHYARMEMDIPADVPEPKLPAGVTLRNYEPERESRALYDAYCAAWQQYEGQEWEAEGFEAWSNDLQGGDFDPSLWFVAEEAGRIVGFIMCPDYPGMGWVQRVGTLPDQRGRGIGRALMLAAFRAYRARGVDRVGLTVSSRNIFAARGLYESLGMEEVLRYDSFRKTIPATGS